MIDLNKEIPYENLTQKDIMQFLLHSTQHVATREELSAVKTELKQDMSKLETSLKQDISEVKQDMSKLETSLKQDMSKLETNLKQDMSKLETNLKQDISEVKNDISKVNSKFDKLQWLIVATLLTVVFKDYIISVLIHTATP